MNKKTCQIRTNVPLTCFSVPIVGVTELKLNLTEEEIYKCLCGKAEVSEILEDGTMIPLDFTNYNKDNSIKKEETEVIIEVFDKVEIKDEVDIQPEEDSTQEETESEEVEESSDEEEFETATPDVVKDYQLPSRNNNNSNKNHKKAKNKR